MTDVVAPPAPRRERDALDRFITIVPFAIAALIILSVIFWQAAVRKTPTVFTDELQWAQLSRGIAETGHAALRGEARPFGSLYSYLIAPAWWIDSTATAYATIKYLNAIVMASASIPVFFLARRLVSPTAAAIAALGTMCTSALFYAAFLLPEVLAYPTFALFALVAFRSLAGDGRRWTIATIALALVAVEVRKELVCAGAAWAIAAAWLWFFGPRARQIRSGWSRGDKAGAALLAVGAFVVVNRDRQPARDRVDDRQSELPAPHVDARARGRLGAHDRSRRPAGDRGARRSLAPRAAQGPALARLRRVVRCVDLDLRPLHRGQGGVPLDGLRDPRRGTQPDLSRPADPDRGDHLLLGAPPVRSRARCVDGVRRVARARLRLSARLPVLRGARLRHRHDGEPLVLVGPAHDPESGSQSRSSSPLRSPRCRSSIARSGLGAG